MNEQQDPNPKISKPMKPLYNLAKRLERFSENAKKPRKQKQCPNCHQYKVYSMRVFLGGMGIMCTSLGLFLIWIPFIGIPLGAFGLLLLAVWLLSLFIPKMGKEMMCQNCRHTWKLE